MKRTLKSLHLLLQRRKVKLKIKQTHIPAIQGLRAFTSQEQAQKAVDIIKTKLDKGIFPPTISIDELQGIGVDIK